MVWSIEWIVLFSQEFTGRAVLVGSEFDSEISVSAAPILFPLRATRVILLWAKEQTVESQTKHGVKKSGVGSDLQQGGWIPINKHDTSTPVSSLFQSRWASILQLAYSCRLQAMACSKSNLSEVSTKHVGMSPSWS